MYSGFNFDDHGPTHPSGKKRHYMISDSFSPFTSARIARREAVERDLRTLGIAKIVHFVRVDYRDPRVKMVGEHTIIIDETLLEGKSSIEACNNVMEYIRENLGNRPSLDHRGSARSTIERRTNFLGNG
jgi:hypothetical protein